jgi:hypothetical protein
MGSRTDPITGAGLTAGSFVITVSSAIACITALWLSVGGASRAL